MLFQILSRGIEPRNEGKPCLKQNKMVWMLRMNKLLTHKLIHRDKKTTDIVESIYRKIAPKC